MSPDNFRFLHTCIKELTFQYKFYESKKLVLFTRCIRPFSAIQCIQLRHTYIVIQYTAVSTHNTVKLLFCVHSIGRPPLFNVLSFYNISDSWIIFRNSACSYHLKFVLLALLYSLILQSLKLQPEQFSFNPQHKQNTERHRWWWISKIVKNSNTMVVVTEGSENSRPIYSKIEPRQNVHIYLTNFPPWSPNRFFLI